MPSGWTGLTAFDFYSSGSGIAAALEMKTIARQIPGYTYGTAEAAQSRVSATELEQLKQSVGFTTDDERYLHMAGKVLEDQTKDLVDTWRGVIAKTPHLARHSKDPEGNSIPRYSEASGLRFQQWILDTCFRPYDGDWLKFPAGNCTAAHDA